MPPRRQPRPIHPKYGADYYSSLDDYPPVHDYSAGRDWSVAHRPTIVRQNSHHLSSRRLNEPVSMTSGYGKDDRTKLMAYGSGPLPPIRRRSSYEYEVEQRPRLPQQHQPKSLTPLIHPPRIFCHRETIKANAIKIHHSATLIVVMDDHVGDIDT